MLLTGHDSKKLDNFSHKLWKYPKEQFKS